MAVTAWSRLTAKGKTRLKNSGVNPASYNAYARKTKKQKAKLNRDSYIRGKTPQQQRKQQNKQAVKTKKQRVIEHMVNVLGGKRNRKPNIKTITRGVNQMGSDELDWTLEADYNDIVEKASEPPPEGKDRNPHWYG